MGGRGGGFGWRTECVADSADGVILIDDVSGRVLMRPALPRWHYLASLIIDLFVDGADLENVDDFALVYYRMTVGTWDGGGGIYC